MSTHNSYAAVIAAAGMSSRMGRFKPLLELGGKPSWTRSALSAWKSSSS